MLLNITLKNQNFVNWGYKNRTKIPFFRKIRWCLAANNQFFKYSRYAVGADCACRYWDIDRTADQ